MQHRPTFPRQLPDRRQRLPPHLWQRLLPHLRQLPQRHLPPLLQQLPQEQQEASAWEAGAAGKVYSIDAKIGQAVKAGDSVVTIEAMKMEIPVVAPQDGTVASIDVAVGDAIEAGALLATLN